MKEDKKIEKAPLKSFHFPAKEYEGVPAMTIEASGIHEAQNMYKKAVKKLKE